MAVSFTTKTVFATDTNATSFSTVSITPTINKILYAIVQSTINSGTGPNIPTLSGNGLTWTQETGGTIQETNANVSRITLFRARVDSVSAGAVTADFGGETQTTCGIVVVELSGARTSGTNGANVMVQLKTGQVSGTNSGITVTLDTAVTSGNASMGFFAIDRGIAMTVGSGYSDAGNTGGSASSLQAEFKATGSATVDASWSSGTTRGMMIAIEVAAEVSSPSASQSPSSSVSLSPSRSPSASVSRSPSASLSPSSSVSLSPSVSVSSSISLSPSASVSASVSPSSSESSSASPSSSISATTSSSPSISGSPSPSLSESSSISPSSSESASPSQTPSPSPSLSISLSPSATQSPSPSLSESRSESSSQSATQSPSPSSSQSPSSSFSSSISPSQAPGSGYYSKEALNSLPTTKLNLAIVYGEEDEADVETDNDVRVPITGSTVYLAHQYRILNNTNQDAVHIRIQLQSTRSPQSAALILQVWNVQTGLWQSLTNNTSGNADSDIDLEYDIDTSISNYFDSDYEITFRVYQETGGVSQTLSVDLVEYCYTTLYFDKYTSVGNSYTSKYSSVGNTYIDKYTSKRGC